MKTTHFFGDVPAGAAPFAYKSDAETVLTEPIEDLSGIGRIEWHLASLPVGFDQPISYDSAGFVQVTDQSGTGVSAVQATAPILTVVTGTAEGKNAPALSWSDTNPAGYVASWTLFRSANPEGMSDADPARSTWQQVGPTFPAGITTFTDASLPAGYTAQYVLRPTLSDASTGPSSNQVVTGMRPSAPTGLVVTGSPQSLGLSWTRQVGATGYDIYRDGKVIATLGDVASFTDGPTQYGWTANPADPSNAGWGHSHTYTVTAQNRWESLPVTHSQNLRASLGDAVGQVYQPSGTTRLTSAPDGAFTAPAAPSLAVTATASWAYALTYTRAPWVGSGPTSTPTQGARDVSWQVDYNSATGPAPSGSWFVFFTGRAVAARRPTPAPAVKRRTRAAGGTSAPLRARRSAADRSARQPVPSSDRACRPVARLRRRASRRSN